jgi:hypothetical protein
MVRHLISRVFFRAIPSKRWFLLYYFDCKRNPDDKVFPKHFQFRSTHRIVEILHLIQMHYYSNDQNLAEEVIQNSEM